MKVESSSDPQLNQQMFHYTIRADSEDLKQGSGVEEELPGDAITNTCCTEL